MKDIIDSVLYKQDIFVKALFERPESLSRLLPYDEYIPDLSIFRHRDGSLGAVFEGTLLEHEPMTGSEIKNAVSSLKSWFNVPTNCVLQVLFEQAHVSPRDPVFRSVRQKYPDPHPVSKHLFEAKVKRIEEACGTGGMLSPFRRHLYISVRYFPEIRTSAKDKLFKRGEAVLFTEMKEFIAESRAFSQIVSQMEKNSRIPLRRLDADALLDVLRRFFNPKTYYKRSFSKFNPNIELSDQFLYTSPTLDFSGITREGVKTRTLSLKTSPQFAYPGGMANFTKLKFPFLLSLNFKFPTKRQTKTFLDLKEFFLENTPSARARRQKTELLEVQEKLANDDVCLHLTFNVTVEGETDDILDERVREVVNLFHNSPGL